MTPLRAIVADEQALFAEMLTHVLNLLPVVTVVARTADGLRLVELVREHQPDLVILDPQLPPLHGLEVVRMIRRDAPATKVLVLTVHRSDETLFQSVEAGVDAYLLKATSSISEMNDALLAVARGETYIAPLSLHQSLKARHGVGPRLAGKQALVLSGRERSILRYLVQGASTKEIARDSGISSKTVRNHISRMYQKVGVGSRAGLAVFAERTGLAD